MDVDKNAGPLKTMLANAITRARKAKGYTQESFAEKAQISTSTYLKIEHANRWPGDKLLTTILDTLGLSLAELLWQYGSAPPEGLKLRTDLADLLKGTESLTERLKAIEATMNTPNNKKRSDGPSDALKAKLGEDLVNRIMKLSPKQLSQVKALIDAEIKKNNPS